MSKLRLPLFLIMLASVPFIIQSCNKDSIVGIAYTTAPFQANINGNVWAPATDSTSFEINYNAGAGTKTLVMQGTKEAKRVIWRGAGPGAETTGGPGGAD